MSPTIKRSGNELTVEKILNAPRELVFEVWTDVSHVIQWWGPEGFTTTNIEMNVKEGGCWRFTMHGPDGRDYSNKIVFHEVVKPERLVYNHSGDDDTNPVNFHVTVTFEAIGPNKTRLTMKSVFSSAEELERLNREFGAIEGARQMMERLDEYLVNLDS